MFAYIDLVVFNFIFMYYVINILIIFFGIRLYYSLDFAFFNIFLIHMKVSYDKHAFKKFILFFMIQSTIFSIFYDWSNWWWAYLKWYSVISIFSVSHIYWWQISIPACFNSLFRIFFTNYLNWLWNLSFKNMKAKSAQT